MSFDEIPVKRLSDYVHVGDFSSRAFDIENYKEFAKASGRNLLEQIDVFIAEKTSAKPLLIAHGNDIETFRIWVDTILKEVPSSKHQYIGGVAISGAALGGGLLEDIQKAVLIAELPLSNIHMLGLGSIKRFLPILIFNHSGLYKKDYHVSYDSTSQTSGISRAAFWHEGKEINLGRHMSETYETAYADINKLFNIADKGIEIKDFYATMMKKDYSKLRLPDGSINEEEVLKFVYSTVGSGATAISNFMKDLDNCYSSLDLLKEYAVKYKISRDVHSLLQIKSLDDFDYWRKHCSHYIKSKRIKKTVETNSLSNLF